MCVLEVEQSKERERGRRSKESSSTRIVSRNVGEEVIRQSEKSDAAPRAPRAELFAARLVRADPARSITATVLVSVYKVAPHRLRLSSERSESAHQSERFAFTRISRLDRSERFVRVRACPGSQYLPRSRTQVHIVCM